MENHSFEYTYCAQRQQEVEKIRKAYLPKEEDKLEQLRSLHAIPTKKAQAASIAVGTVGALILGTGMSLCMTEIAPCWEILRWFSASLSVLPVWFWLRWHTLFTTERRKKSGNALRRRF